jgi:uncharacterized protein
MKTPVYAFLILALVSICEGQKLNAKKNYVFDNSKLLTATQIDSLNTAISELERTIGSQLMILTINTLHGQKIEEYSLKIANDWGIGRKEYDDGILITVVSSDKQMRIEVGYGLEKIIKDETAARIIREKIVPRFEKGRFFNGLYDAVKEIKFLIKRNKDMIGQRP